VRRFFVGFFRALIELLNHPPRVLWLCGLFIVLNSVLDRSLFHLWSLYRDQARLGQELTALQTHSADLKSKLQTANDPSFLEKEARDRFDLVSAGDLVFVFTDEQELEEK
jgi:cell division protein FtsB